MAKAKFHDERHVKLRAQKRADYERHREKRLAQMKAARQADPVKAKDTFLRKTYGITLAERDAMWAAQGGVCAICHQKPTGGRGDGIYVDHDHETNKIRGLLCGQCNCLLGYARDNVLTLESAIRYLQEQR